MAPTFNVPPMRKFVTKVVTVAVGPLPLEMTLKSLTVIVFPPLLMSVEGAVTLICRGLMGKPAVAIQLGARNGEVAVTQVELWEPSGLMVTVPGEPQGVIEPKNIMLPPQFNVCASTFVDAIAINVAAEILIRSAFGLLRFSFETDIKVTL